MPKAERALYGSRGMYRVRCPECGHTSLVVDGCSACCDVELDKPKTFRTRRHTEGDAKRRCFPVKVRRQVLEDQEHACFYCGILFGDYYWSEKAGKVVRANACFDHFIPWVYCRSSTAENVVASCQICNGIKSSKVFDDKEQAVRYVRDRRQTRGYEPYYDQGVGR